MKIIQFHSLKQISASGYLLCQKYKFYLFYLLLQTLGVTIKLLSKAGTGQVIFNFISLIRFFYTTRKNPMNTPNKLKLIKVEQCFNEIELLV